MRGAKARPRGLSRCSLLLAGIGWRRPALDHSISWHLGVSRQPWRRHRAAISAVIGHLMKMVMKAAPLHGGGDIAVLEMAEQVAIGGDALWYTRLSVAKSAGSGDGNNSGNKQACHEIRAWRPVMVATA